MTGVIVAIANAVFPLGRLVTTCGVAAKMESDPVFHIFALNSLQRHAAGDWGDMCAHDKAENEYARGQHLRLFSAYENGTTKIWIITEADRSATTILFPEEY